MTTDTSGEPDPGGSSNAVRERGGRPAQAVIPALRSGQTAPGGPAAAAGQRLAGRPVLTHLAILAGYLAAGIALTWPRASYLVEGKLPTGRDAGVYVWDFWWMLHQIEHFSNPWYTRFIAAPVGAQLGYHALMPLEGVVMLPVTIVFGPSASYNLLSVLMPGLSCYAMYRAARLWLPSQTGAIAAGAFFGLSSELAWHAFYQLNLAAGVLFLPLALEAAVRLRRRPRWRQAALLGVVVGASLLTDQESAVLVATLAALVLLSWLVSGGLAALPGRAGPAGRAAAWAAPPGRVLGRRLALTAAVAGTALLVASPQIAAMVAQAHSGGATLPPALVDKNYVTSGSYLPGLVTVSPRVISLGLTALKPASYQAPIGDGIPTFGLVLSVLAVAGLAVTWRQRASWLLALLWLGSAALALGATLRIGTHVYVPAAELWHGVRVSALMPFTWFVQVPGLAGFREAARIMMLGLVPAALLAGAAVSWLRYHAPLLLIPVLALGVLEAGWSGTPGVGVMRTALPQLDRPIAADHSGSIVVDAPFGIRGGVPLPGEGAAFDPESQVLATADGHPRAVAYLSRIPGGTLAAVRRNPFYAGLLDAQGAPRMLTEQLTGTTSYQGLLAAARQTARRTGIGWVVLWQPSPDIQRYLRQTGFRLDYTADGAQVYRPHR
ncbi:MAG TPA: hypothetical protein VN597_00980 [Streptosporangiaceae bacterium]|nr:hypothetical protein [Streptosporangiaceae bacterium]